MVEVEEVLSAGALEDPEAEAEAEVAEEEEVGERCLGGWGGEEVPFSP